ncbi:hypothetical protein SAMN02745912_00831 [Paramaledivibacter caminithermalis DSM 15212]|uniref:Uncharacterized protein n=2 Tax=Paramaledivibacter TaxID=1884934 RepID=A0A1M6LJG0_PARC5|nr:hypothetical protein SAMN02745912_00831 [Paramaledivibacter caminithermalis DSM 15212]
MKSDKFVNFTVIDKESDLHISAKTNLEKEAKKYLKKYRNAIRTYGDDNANFYKSLSPIDVADTAAKIVKHMAEAAKIANVGPMAAVAGAISQYVGLDLLKHTDEIIIENGGDIFIKTNKERKILIYAGESPFSEKLALLISPEDTPMGICTSAGTIGHSLSFGNADAVVVLSKDSLAADAVATAIGNIIKEPSDIDKGIQYGKAIKGIEGILIIIKDKMGAWGKVELVKP